MAAGAGCTISPEGGLWDWRTRMGPPSSHMTEPTGSCPISTSLGRLPAGMETRLTEGQGRIGRAHPRVGLDGLDCSLLQCEEAPVAAVGAA